MVSSAILAVLTLIEGLLPMLGTSAATASLVDNIINALVQLMPYIVNEIATIYAAAKNIISLLQNNGQPTADQLAALQSLDAQVDAAWAAAQASIDPDAPGGDPAASPSST